MLKKYRLTANYTKEGHICWKTEEHKDGDVIPAKIGQEMYDALEDAIRGMEWRIEHYPWEHDGSDYEKLEEWKAILAKAEGGSDG